MILILSLLINARAFADDRVVAVFPRAHRVITEVRANGLVEFRECEIPAGSDQDLVDCGTVGVALPDDSRADAAFDRQLDLQIEEFRRARARGARTARWMNASLVAGLGAFTILGARGERPLRDLLKVTVPLTAAFVGVSALGDHWDARLSRRRIAVLDHLRRTARSGAAPVVFRDRFLGHLVVVRALAEATRDALVALHESGSNPGGTP